MKPFLFIKNNLVFELNNQFEILTGYSREELLGKSIAEISNMLRIDSQVNLEDIEGECSCYIFTKEFELREVTFFYKKNKSKNEQFYLLDEIMNSRIEDRLPFIESILTDNEFAAAIYSIPDKIFLKCNIQFLNFCNKKIENCIGKRLKEIFPECSGSDFENLFSNIVKTGKTYHIKKAENKLTENGETYWDTSVVPMYIKGKAKYMIYTAIDVTEMIVNRKIIEKQKQELEAVIENMSDEMIIFNKNAEYIKINKSGREKTVFDYSYTNKLEEVYRQAEFYDMDGDLIPFDGFAYKRICSGEKIADFRYVFNSSKGIRFRELSGTPIYDSSGNFIAGIIVFHDITDRLKYERNLYIKAQYDSLSKIIENLDLGFARYTYPDFKFIDINNKGYNQLKRLFPDIGPQSSIKSQNLFDVFDGKVSTITEMIQDSLKNNNTSCFKTSKYNRAGEEIFFKWIYQPLFGLNNEIIEIIIIGMDVTKEEKDKEKMEKVLKIQDEVYANVSHELKTPLNVIFSANQLIEMYLKNDSFEDNKEKFSYYNNIIKQNCYRLIKLINNIVDLSKSNSGFLSLNLSNENIVNVVENIVQSVSEYVKSKGLRIIFDTDIEEKIIACDPSKIERVILNLISNAIKFSDPNGNIYVNIFDKGDVIEISVKDTGTGIEKKHLELIFQRFYQADKSLSRNSEGTGIGLSLIKSIVELHGGNISVESKIGKGSIFTVELPVRTIENPKPTAQTNYMNNNIEMINVEFSDIYAK
jgi:signal transduction histidine kinase